MSPSLLSTTLLSELLPTKPSLIQVDSKATSLEALKILADNNILSAPIYDSSREQYVGLTDVFCLAWDLVLNPDGSKNSVVTENCFEKIHVLEPTDTLKSFVDVDLSKRAYRVLVKTAGKVLEGQRPYQLVSETDVVKYVLKKSEELGDLQKKTLTDLGLANPTGKVVSVEKTCSVKEGFRRMFQENLNALAVVDANGTLVGNLSVSDLRGLTSETLNKVDQSIESFFGNKMAVPVACDTKATLTEVMLQAVTAKTHRVYVTELEKPVAVVTFADVLKALRD